MTGAAKEADFIVEQRFVDQIVAALEQSDRPDNQIDVAFAQCVVQLANEPHRQRDGDAFIGRKKVTDDGGQEDAGDERRRADAQPSGLATAETLRNVACPQGGGADGLADRRQLQADCGGNGPAGCPIEQSAADPLLEDLDRARQRWLGDAQRIGRRLEGAQLYNGRQLNQMAWIENHHFS